MKILKTIVIVVSILTIGNYSYTSNTNQQMFQPADGSMKNGTYNTTNNTAKTVLQNYSNVIAIDGTTETPKLTSLGKYVDKNGNQLEAIGSYSQYSNDSGNTNIYYLFGNILDPKTQMNSVINEPIETYSSQSN